MVACGLKFILFKKTKYTICGKTHTHKPLSRFCLHIDHVIVRRRISAYYVGNRPPVMHSPLVVPISK